MISIETKPPQWSHIAERVKQSNTKQECVPLLQVIQSFLSEGCRKEECNKYLLLLMKDVVSPCLFRSLLLLSIDNIMGKGGSAEAQLMDLLSGLVDKPQRKEVRSELGVILLKNRGQLMKKMVESCRSSESRTESLLALVNSVILEGIQRESINNYNFTQIVLLASQSLLAHSELGSATISDAIRLLLIVDAVQKGEVIKMMVSSEVLLNAVSGIIKKQQLSGFAYYLMGKLLLQGGEKEKIQQLCLQIARQVEQRIDITAELDGQIDKIRFSDNKSRQRIDLIQKIRGICFFVGQYVSSQLRQGTITDKWVRIVQKLLQIKDFQCFEHLLPAFISLIQAGTINATLTPSIINAIQSNCLPLRSSKLHEDGFSALDLNFYAQQFCPSPHTQITTNKAPLMLRLTQLMMQSRGYKHKRTICGCCEEYIHTAIEKQYQLDFNPHEFMSACHLMSREISRISSMGASGQELAVLKDYLINNLKWLLNLNESCLPQYRKWINFKVFDLLLVFPPFFENNQFLREVVDELLIGRLPQTMSHLEELVVFYQKEKKDKELLHLREKLLKKLSGQGLALRDRVKIWSMMAGRTQPDRLKDYIDIEIANEESVFARYMVLSNRKVVGSEKLQHKAEEIKGKWEASPSIFEEELEIYRKFRQAL